MKKNTYFSASRQALLVLVCIIAHGFAACGGDDEPTVDELLSDKTTPVTFQLPQGDYYMFDYSGSRYVGSDTIHVDWSGKCEIELRQGDHNILWVRHGDDGREYAGIIYDVTTRRFLHHGESQDLSCGWSEISVAPYLLPTQKVELEYLTATLQIEPSDELPFTPVENGNYIYEYKSPIGTTWITYRFISVGTFTGPALVQSISADDGGCVFGNETKWSDIVAAGMVNGANQVIIGKECRALPLLALCPSSGIPDIQLTSKLSDANNLSVSTTQIPIFSLRRGYTTILRGPLFSGSTADWTVKMEPYK